ncbi:MAG: MarR family winged helix-turn-helix transcriptional regulator [Alphaproteobacteria bacterium]
MTTNKDIPSEQSIAAWAHLVHVSQALLANVEADLKTAGQPPLSWYDALLELNRVAPGGLRPFQLQERMLLAQYNLSRLVDRLVNADYVERRPSKEDGRGNVLKITRQGRKMLRQMWPIYRQAIQTHFSAKLDDRDSLGLSWILGKLRD